MSIEERFDMEREDRRHEGTLARLSGRLKFAYCHRCGSEIGMQAVHRDALAEMTDAEIKALEPWYQATWDMEHMYYMCPACNQEKIAPEGFYLTPISLSKILEWRNDGPAEPDFEPDYAALAAEEPVSQIGDSRESAGMEG